MAKAGSLASRPSWVQGLDLNQRPSGYEPDELPGCSTLQQRRGRTLVARMGASRGFFDIRRDFEVWTRSSVLSPAVAKARSHAEGLASPPRSHQLRDAWYDHSPHGRDDDRRPGAMRLIRANQLQKHLHCFSRAGAVSRKDVGHDRCFLQRDDDEGISYDAGKR